MPEPPPSAARPPRPDARVAEGRVADACIADAHVAEVLVATLARRAPDATICPSEVARALAPEAWRPLMPAVRAVAYALARAGRVEIRQRGVTVSPDVEARGAIRIGRVRRGSR